jgi:hypothetical protein
VARTTDPGQATLARQVRLEELAAIHRPQAVHTSIDTDDVRSKPLEPARTEARSIPRRGE